jgi:DNA mismatch repair protein MutL
MPEDRVRLLDETTANQIAAGEVIERPASAVKELVENAVDAGATQIRVELEEGGKRRIVVSDDGCGMSRNDAVMALQRHATSKIVSAQDLFAIRTLGFRGEALPSIASVSHLVLITKSADGESATRIVVDGGDMLSVEETAWRSGTSIDVSDLFFNTPARLKFLKSTPTEVGRAVDVVGQLSIAYPHVAFRLSHNGQEIFSTPGTGQPLGALAAVWGREIARRLIPVEYESPGLAVRGHIAEPDVTRPGRSHELFFVNRRPIKSRLLAHALEEAFRALTPESRYPVAALGVEISADLVDVNVHPTKSEVKFTRDGEVHHAISQAIKSGLLEFGILPQARLDTSVPETPPSAQVAMFGSGGTAADPSGMAAFPIVVDWRADDMVLAARPAGTVDEGAGGPVGGPEGLRTEGVEPLQERPRPKPFAERLREFRILGQARNTYILALTPDGIAVIDQHVAHERVLYERLTVSRFANGIPVQRLAVPMTVNMSRREAVLLGEHCKSFGEAGWEIEPFGGESFVIRAVPSVLANKPYERILLDMVDELCNQSVTRRLLVQKDHVTITNACKMAVKAGDPLNIEEMEALLAQLRDTENPYLCPHGRPIVVTIPFSELDRQFKRAR